MSIDPEVLAKVQGLRSYLAERLRGQDHVLDRAVAVFVRGELGLTLSDRPRGALLAVGPTGTGKTELVLLCARHLFGDGSVRRFDLSEFQRADAVERLLGADASDGGAIGWAARREGPRVWLFDELEKAHSKVFDLFLQMLDPGAVTLATGRVISFVGDYIAFTSNLGGAEALRMARSSFASVELATLRRVAEALRPEFVARIPNKFVFARLKFDVQREIAQMHIEHEIERLGLVGFDLEVSREAMDYLVRLGCETQLGAREIRQTVERNLQEAVVQALLSTGSGAGRVHFDVRRNGLCVNQQAVRRSASA